MKRKRIYIDNNATTVLDPNILKKMLPYMKEYYGNPSSAHAFGWEAEAAFNQAKEDVACLIGAKSTEIFFTSGATEADNWIIKNWAYKKSSKIFTSPIEHKAILQSIKGYHLESRAYFFGVGCDGDVVLDSKIDILPQAGDLVSLMGVNNEIHTILDLEKVGKYCEERGSFFHSDCAQAIGKIPIDVRKYKIDALSISAHKIYGPKGVGVLYISEALQENFIPLIYGGGQQNGLRSGTIPVASIVGCGEACRLARLRIKKDTRKSLALAKLFLKGLEEYKVKYEIIGPQDLSKRQSGSLSLFLRDIDASKFCEDMPEVALSQSSACKSQEKGSHVLSSINLDPAKFKGIIRVSFGRFNNESEVMYVCKRLGEFVHHSSQ